jgi:hypothetical protein
MPFIGNKPALSYTSFAKQDFTTSVTTSYTLDNPVANANELALFINLFVASPQIELGAFPTSYIPTVASQVTRNADAATMTGTNFSSWYRADEGSFYAEAMPANIAQNPYIFTAESDISNLIQSIASSTFHFRSFVGGVTQADIDAGTFSFPTTLYIGADSSAVRCITIKKLAYYPARLSNTELQGLTS